MKPTTRFFGVLAIAGLFAVSMFFSREILDLFLIPKQFYFLIFVTCILLGLLVYAILKIKITAISFNRTDIAFSIFTVYCCLSYLMKNGIENTEQELFISIYFLIVYFLIKQFIKSNKNTPILQYIFFAVLIFPFLQALYGFLQWAGVFQNYMEKFKIGGSFGNPGEYANYLVSVLPLAMGITLLKKDGNKFSGRLKLIAILTSCSIVLMLPLTNARTAWVAAFIGFVLMINDRFSLINKISLKLKSPLLKISVLSVALVMVIFISFKLYHYKESSSEGRIFIWKTTINVIKEHPVFGTGFNTFTHSYNIEQAAYFRTHPMDVKAMYLADNALFAFNDYLEIASETGVFGLIIFLFLIFSVSYDFLKNIKNETEHKNLLIPVFVSFVIILITAFFSYPFRNIAVYLFFIVYIAILSSASGTQVKQIKVNPFAVKVVLLLLLLLLFPFLKLQITRYKANLEWYKAFGYVQQGNNDQVLNLYKELYPTLQYSGNFLYNYGAEMSKMGYFDESLEVLSQCEEKINDANFYTYLGNNYEGLNRLTEAETAYWEASYRIPNKLYPKYRLVYVYAKKNDTAKAIQMAKTVLAMKPKVESDVSRQMKADMEQFLSANKSMP